MRSRLSARVQGWLICALTALVRLYQVCLRPVLPAVCRFYPSCSEYFLEAVHKHGPLRGVWMGCGRICRCHPWSAGGYDPP
jgi:putative membrane protein insertion efficiency factor